MIPVRDGWGFGSLVALGIHTFVVYACALHLSPWLVYHWFGWVAPMLQISSSTPATDWYLQHLEMMTIVPALVLGHVNVIRFFHPTIRSYFGSGSAAAWAWAVPVIVLGYKMLLYDASSSVLYGTSMSAIGYFLDIQKVMPTRSNFLTSDPIRVLAQMTVTAPFYAGIAYSLGGLASKHRLLAKFFTSERRDEPESS